MKKDAIKKVLKKAKDTKHVPLPTSHKDLKGFRKLMSHRLETMQKEPKHYTQRIDMDYLNGNHE